MTRKSLAACMCAVVLSLPMISTVASVAAGGPLEAIKTVVKNPLIKGTLKQAIRQCEKLAGVQIVVEWPVLKAAGVGPDDKVLIKASKATVEQLLEMMLIQVATRGNPLAWYVDENQVRVTSQRRILYTGNPPVARAPVRSRAAVAVKKSSRPKQGLLRELNFNNIKLVNVVDFLRDVSGVSIHVNWRSMETIGVTRETTVTLKAKNISIARALDLLMDDISGIEDKFSRVYWIIDEGIVRIATGAALNQKLKTRIIEVGDLLMLVPDFVAPRIEFNPTAVSGTGSNSNRDTSSPFADEEDDRNSDRETPAQQRKRMRDNLIGMIKESIGEDMWQPQGKGSIRIMRGKLIISQTMLGFKLMERAGR